jgi:hypothetical protein
MGQSERLIDWAKRLGVAMKYYAEIDDRKRVSEIVDVLFRLSSTQSENWYWLAVSEAEALESEYVGVMFSATEPAAV